MYPQRVRTSLWEKWDRDKIVLCANNVSSLGGDDTVKFFEQSFTVKVDSIFNFITSLVSGLVLAPIRLVQEVSKKAVYLKRKELDLLFFVAIVIGIGVTIAVSIGGLKTGVFDVRLGKFPVILMLVTDGIMVAGYALFSTVSSVVYDNVSELKKTVLGTSCDETVVDTVKNEAKDELNVDAVNEEKMSCESTTCVGDNIREWFSENDDFAASENIDVISSQEIRDYQNKLRDGIADLQGLQQQVQCYATEELENLKSKLDAVTPPSKFIDKEFIENIGKNADIEEISTLEEGVLEIPDDFKLCLNQ